MFHGHFKPTVGCIDKIRLVNVTMANNFSMNFVLNKYLLKNNFNHGAFPLKNTQKHEIHRIIYINTFKSLRSIAY